MKNYAVELYILENNECYIERYISDFHIFELF